MKGQRSVMLHKAKIGGMDFKLTNSGVSQINEELQGITERLLPTYLKNLRSSSGGVSQLNKFIPDLAAECSPFGDFEKDAIWNWQIMEKRLKNKDK